MKKLLLLLVLSLTATFAVFAQNADSTRVMKLLAAAPKGKTTGEYMLHFGKALAGTPYVAQTLENPDGERLVVNLRQLDCTTLVENALALSLCMRSDKKTFGDFKKFIRTMRYDRGKVSYASRLHYFSSWISSNQYWSGIIKEVAAATAPFTATKDLRLDFMSKHADLYPALKGNPTMTDSIRATEKTLVYTHRYIPKSALKKYDLLRKYIEPGDIIAIVTNKEGLDVSHLGIASWHNDGTLHLLNASQIHKKVIDEPMTLYDYMQKHPSQIGIRVIRPIDKAAPTWITE